MSKDANAVPLSRVVELLEGLGLDPVDPESIASVHIERGVVEVARYRRSKDGGLIPLVDGRVPTEVVTIPMEYDR